MENEQKKHELSEDEKEILAELEKLLPDLLGLRTKEDAIAKSIEGLLNKEKLRMLSLLFPDEDRELALYLIIGEIFEIDWMEAYVDALLELRCSRMGWRASTIESIAKETRKEQGVMGFFRRLLGKKEKEPPLGKVETIE